MRHGSFVLQAQKVSTVGWLGLAVAGGVLAGARMLARR
jgi:hypothetical protein